MGHTHLCAPDQQLPSMPGQLHFAMLTHGALTATQRCVESLVRHTAMPFELWIVDNASDDGTRSWLAAQNQSWFHHRCNASNRGVPGRRNDLLDFALPQLGECDWLVFINNDLEFMAGWLEPFLDAMRSFPNARVLSKTGHFIEIADDARYLAPAPIDTSQVDIVSGGFACFVRADAAQRIGAFDEHLENFWHEGDDYCVRALQQGFDVVAVPESAILHHEHASGVVEPGLREGGSLVNQAYLAAKWRAAGWIDGDGWVIRSHGPYLTPDLRRHLERLSSRTTHLGRTEVAAAIGLLENLIEQPEPMAWLDGNRQPVPQCFSALVALHQQQATADGNHDLASRLSRIATDIFKGCNATLLRAMLSPAGQQKEGKHGVCSGADFNDPDWLRVADSMGVGQLMRDPFGRDRRTWQAVTTVCRLSDEGLVTPGVTVLVVGMTLPLLTSYLAEQGVELIAFGARNSKLAKPGAVLFGSQTGIDCVRQVLADCPDRALAVFTGDVSLNGTPSMHVLQPHQIDLDLLARAGLRAIGPVRTVIDDEVLEACANRPGREDALPHLSQLRKTQLVTSFVVLARRAGIRRPTAVVHSAPLQPTKFSVGVDLRTLSHSESMSRGIGQYTLHHLTALARRAPDLRFLGYGSSERGWLPPDLSASGMQWRDLDSFAAPDVDLVHIPDPMNMRLGFDSPLRVMRHPTTTVLFHDLTPLHYYMQRWSNLKTDLYADRIQQISRSNAHLLTNSEFTAKDLQQHLGISPERTTPVLAGLHGSGRQEMPPSEDIADTLDRLGVRPPFILHVGAHEPHKNFPAALSTFLRVRSHRPSQLVVVGSIDERIEYMAAVCAAKKIPDVIFTGFLPREHLDCLYAAATALLFLSRAEGFGFPVLEAMAAGCPVISANTTSLPEVVSDAGVLVDPDDQEAAAAAIERLLDDREYAEQLRVAGQTRAEQFTWDAVADRTLEVWRHLLEPNAARPIRLDLRPSNQLESSVPGPSPSYP